jgi:hypothetical protein
MDEETCAELSKVKNVVVMKVCHLSVTQSDAVGEGWMSVY